MVNGKTPLYLTLLAAALLGMGLLVSQPYSADWPGRAYADPAQRYVRAALRADSAALVRLSASSQPVMWALDAARSRPGSLRPWARRVHAWTGERTGDTAEVFVYPDRETWDDAPIVLRFVGARGRAKVLRASSTWIDSGVGPE